jgi:hypothetical protein
MRGFIGVAAALLLSTIAAEARAQTREADPGASEGAIVDWFRSLRRPRDPYALDDVSRRLSEGVRVDCASVPLVTYRGERVRYTRPVRIHPAFEERLERFEQIVADTAIAIYGRAPRRIDHAGTFACRPVRGRDSRLSEHALGNAIDVSGFRFGPATRDERARMPAELPSRLRWAFSVSVSRHWEADGAIGETHERFLAALAGALREEPIFRGMIGPRHPRHRNHLHLDAGPYRYDWL